MKHLLKLSAIFTILILFVSCNKENDEIQTQKNTIIGKWVLVSYEISNFENTHQTIDDFASIFPRPTFDFKTDGKCFINSEIMTKTIDYEVVGDEILFKEAIAFGHNSFFYTLLENTLILTKSDSFNNDWGDYTENTKVILMK